MTIAALAASAVLALKAGTLIDGTGAPPLHDVTVLVEAGRIASLENGGRIPPGAEVVNLANATVLPGFVDAHVHLALRTFGDGDWAHTLVTMSSADLALLGAVHAQQTLESGFTTVRVVGSIRFEDVSLRDAVNAGWLPGPRILAAGTPFGILGGHCDATAGLAPGAMPERGLENGVANGVEGVREAVRYAVKYGADVVKICATGGVLSPGDLGIQQYTEEEMRAAVETARLLGRRVAAHAHGFVGGRAREACRLAAAAGVRIALGTDSGVGRHGTNAHEFGLLHVDFVMKAGAIVVRDGRAVARGAPAIP